MVTHFIFLVRPIMEISSTWRHFPFWLQHKLSFRQLPVQILLNISSTCHFHFRVIWPCSSTHNTMPYSLLLTEGPGLPFIPSLPDGPWGPRCPPSPWRRQYLLVHDDDIKWKHLPRYWPLVRGIHRSPVNSPRKGQWRGALIFSLICAWVNG